MMNLNHLNVIADELDLRQAQVQSTATLLTGGATIPFIARYRKEATGLLDEVAISNIRDRLEQLDDLEKRRAAVIKSLDERDLLSGDLRRQIEGAATMAGLEDLYLPYRPKRRTRATMAREKGLEPLAQRLLEGGGDAGLDPFSEAGDFVDLSKQVTNPEEALAGARDIIAETVSEDMAARERMRELFWNQGTIRTRMVKGKEEEGAKFKDYFDWEEDLSAAPSHRVLAMRRGEREKVLTLRAAPPDDVALNRLRPLFVKGRTPAAEQVSLAVEDGYKRLLGPSIEAEIRQEMKSRADEEAIRVFAENLKELLLAPPLGQKRMLAIDPGFRTGCKVVCLNRQGRLEHYEAIFPHGSARQFEVAAERMCKLCRDFDVESIAIGNGTASRETESFVRGLGLPAEIPVIMVNESGASIYSASEVARREFPDHDVTVRGAVSIGRRLMDPLAELVKIDPKSIGVGQYQHDVDQKGLRRSLDDCVMSCVNAVGVDVNTASQELLTYVSGLGPQLASNIVAFRNENGPFPHRRALKKVPRLGPKAFEQAAGFLRVPGGENPLDASAVHPESYPIVQVMCRDLSCSVAELVRQESLRNRIRLENYLSDAVGMPTLQDIVVELAKPGRDPRRRFELFSFAGGIEKIEDLDPGMKLPGLVTNVTAFGAFVDIGVHHDGLVHISQLADRYVKDPAEVVKVQQKVEVTVIAIDLERKRISLSMKSQRN